MVKCVMMMPGTLFSVSVGIVTWSKINKVGCWALEYRIALNFRGAHFSRFHEFGKTMKYMHHENFLKIVTSCY